MNELQKEKRVTLLPPQLKDNGDFSGNTYVDTSGWQGACLVEFIVGTLDTAIGSVDETTPPLLEWADKTDFSDKVDIPGAALSAVIGATDDDKTFGIEVNLGESHKRYIRPKTPHAGDGAVGANLCIRAILSVAQVSPVNAAERGYEEYVIV